MTQHPQGFGSGWRERRPLRKGWESTCIFRVWTCDVCVAAGSYEKVACGRQSVRGFTVILVGEGDGAPAGEGPGLSRRLPERRPWENSSPSSRGDFLLFSWHSCGLSQSMSDCVACGAEFWIRLILDHCSGEAKLLVVRRGPGGDGKCLGFLLRSCQKSPWSGILLGFLAASELVPRAESAKPGFCFFRTL